VSTEDAARRAQRIARYDELRAERPALFVNPPGAAYEILFDLASQTRVADESAAALGAAGIPTEYGDIGVVYEDSFKITLRDAVRFRDGRLGAYVRTLGAVAGIGAAAVPLLSDGRVLLVRQFRHERRTWRWEIPRGFGEPGADGATTAARELEEETGLVAAEMLRLGRVGPDEIYLARIDAGTLPAELPAGAADEGIDGRRLIPWTDLAALIASGEISDEYLLIAYTLITTRGIPT
jgi:ADP-ribose pyrophosphatase